MTDTTATKGRAAWDLEVQGYRIHLTNGRKSPATLRGYLTSLASFAAFQSERGADLDPRATTRRDAQAYLAHLLATGSMATARTRFVAVSTFYRWLASEGEEVLTRSPFANITVPAAPQVRVPVVSDDAVVRLLAATEGASFEARRDRALLALMVSTGLRRQEVADLLVEDLGDLGDRQLEVRSGKGDRPRRVAFHHTTGEALRQYLRVRAAHRDADLVVTVGARAPRQGRALFLVSTGTGHRGGLGSEGIAKVLARRAAEAGLDHIHPHQLRHTWAHGALAGGAQEGQVMRLGGWRTRDMLDRYGADLAQERALEAAVDPLDAIVAKGKRGRHLRAVS